MRGAAQAWSPGTNWPTTPCTCAFDQMQGRGISPSVVDDAIANGLNLGGDGASIFYSEANNISVVVNSEGRVITVGYGMFKPR